MPVSALNSNMFDYVKALNRIAMKHKKVAEILVFQEGLKGNVTPKFVRHIDNKNSVRTFDSNFNFTKESLAEITELLKEHKLPGDATLYKLLDAEVKSSKDNKIYLLI
jgi:uncharacterized protein YkvS